MTRRGRLALVALAVMVIFLLATLLGEADRRQMADRRRDAAIAALTKTNEGIVGKLTEVFVKAQAAEEAAKAAGVAPQATVAQIVEGLKGYVDPKLIEQAIRAAKGTPGPQGKPGPQGPPGTSAPATTSTSSPSTSTSTTTSSTTTTTTRGRPPTTTTTRCAVGAVGLCLVR